VDFMIHVLAQNFYDSSEMHHIRCTNDFS